MGYNRRVTGKIQIKPPLIWSEFRDTPVWSRNPHRDGQLHVMVKTEQMAEGELRKLTATSIGVSDERRSFRDLEEDIQAIVDTWPDREYTGFLLCDWEEGQQTRIMVKDRRVVEVKPVVTWSEV